MTQFAIAGLQLQLPHADNLDRIVEATTATLKRYPWVEMVVVSELAVRGASLAAAEALPSDTERKLQELAQELKIWFLPGSLYEKRDGKILNTIPVIDPDGKVVCRYSKIFPFYPYEQGVTEGTGICTFEVPNVGCFGVSNCYDIWFPELNRALILQGAEVILHPSMTNTQDRDIERSIIRATAAQNQCYVVDVNGAGAQGYGKSYLAGPDGEIIHSAGSNEETMLLEVDFERIRRLRERGLMGLGQPLKSFRDSSHPLTQIGPSEALNSLGELAVPKRIRATR